LIISENDTQPEKTPVRHRLPSFSTSPELQKEN
jgi:hypothetical protein